QAIALGDAEAELMEGGVHVLGERTSAGDEQLEAPTELPVHRPEQELAQVEFAAPPQLPVELHEAVDRLLDEARTAGHLLGDAPVQQLEEGGDADHRADAPALEHLAQTIGGELVDVGHPGA